MASRTLTVESAEMLLAWLAFSKAWFPIDKTNILIAEK